MSPLVTHSDPLAVIKVIDRLEVGPVRLEARRLLAPYTVHQGDRVESFEFIYRFEEDVFDQTDAASRNLADMMAVQVVLNYGLFCDEIAFRGAFDAVDRQFLDQMARNTAQEIYVKKFLEPNPFLKEAVRGLPVVERDSYLQARLVFDEASAGKAQATAAPRAADPSRIAADPSRIAVLSSGGKESLLSESLLREMGHQTHPIFVNESGKHWFTALNAYRHYAANRPNTARVWTNSDRLFAWMLRRLPFVREDFFSLRADEYPIRLWTVAIFLFGALPLVRKRGAGSLVIGDEFDTTVRKSHHGIAHYDGLYDQSRYFDQAMSQYFHRKGWPIRQFSILRPLSELLVEKVLVERYPEIQRLQVSCHAAHMDGDCVRPCGHCEKCARVVGMLKALGADPGNCGYTPTQIDRCLSSLATRGASQEPEALQHLAFVLHQRQLLPTSAIGNTTARKQNEVMKLRFDPERSPPDDLPVDLRKPLYHILLQHADGAVRKTGKRWMNFDPLTGDAAQPDSAEAPRAESTENEGLPIPQASYLLGELTWPEAQQRFREVDVALLPVGAIEQHGPHLPLDTDTFDVDYLCRLVAEQCTDPKPLVLPSIPYGVSYHHDDFPGTISLGPETLSRLIHDIGLGAARHGIRKLVIVNGHGGNVPALHFAAQLINRDAHIFTCVDSGETSDADVEALAETRNDVHAGEIETSASLAVRPELVRMDRACKFVPKFSSRYLDFGSKRSVNWYARTTRLSPSGVLGDPTVATKEKGEKIWRFMVEHLVGLVEDLKRMSLAEIHQERGE